MRDSNKNIFYMLLFFAMIGWHAIFLKEEISLSTIVGTLLTLIAVKILNNIRIFRKS